MVERLTVIFFILLCLLLGSYLILAPWDRLFGLWSANYLLAFTADKLHMPSLVTVVSSNWFRGAVTGLGIVNVLVALWEAANFSDSVRRLQEMHTEGIRK